MKFSFAKSGKSVQVTKKVGNKEEIIEDNETENIQRIEGEHDATVGGSVSLGNNTDYGAHKIEVSVWKTFPCKMKDRDIAWETCKEEIIIDAGDLFDSVVERYVLPFPKKTQNLPF